ncbi:glycerophosphodiester phosphodiesterase GDPD2-like [Curcuma longa]|uniref:glycerophosphodiester phosphodiesterase GDPD2-like n=1 Tax=Curcuma longa TaxID=136217 RepID=UPI003D9EA4CE
MALKAVLASGAVPNLDQVRLPAEAVRLPERAVASGFVVLGHRGKGMNVLASPDRRMSAVKENSILSFNRAARFPIDSIEFDVQVTKDDCPIIFHDDVILTEHAGEIMEKRVTDLCLEEFLSYGPQRDPSKVGKLLLRRAHDGRVLNWNVEDDDYLCTLQEAFEKVDPRLGFNIELKFVDHVVYSDQELVHALEAVLKVVYQYAGERAIIFSTFQPDAGRLIRKLQSAYPVFFLTTGGTEIHDDIRRNSLDEAIKLCLAGGLQGIVSEVRGIFRHPSAVSRIKESNLSLLTYGKLNNVPEAVYLQHLMGINGVIVDLVEEITESVSDIIQPALAAEFCGSAEPVQAKQGMRPGFSERELSFLLKLIPELVQH